MRMKWDRNPIKSEGLRGCEEMRESFLHGPLSVVLNTCGIDSIFYCTFAPGRKLEELIVLRAENSVCRESCKISKREKKSSFLC